MERNKFILVTGQNHFDITALIGNFFYFLCYGKHNILFLCSFRPDCTGISAAMTRIDHDSIDNPEILFPQGLKRCPCSSAR